VSVSARYVFAVARGLRAEDLVGAAAFDGAQVQVIEHAGLSAVVCEVDLAEFGQEPLTNNLEDLAWVERTARIHNEVVWRVAGCATCAPLRLATICSSDASVRAKVDALRTDLNQVLDRVEGRQEWSLKVLVRRQPAVVAAPTAAASSGVEYLRRKREAADQRREQGEDAARAAHDLDQVARAHSVAARRLTVQDPRISGRSEAMVLNAAYLVEAEAHETFRARVGAEAEQHAQVSVELDGPWPPYSFAVLA
jgi:hypothetical protein